MVVATDTITLYPLRYRVRSAGYRRVGLSEGRILGREGSKHLEYAFCCMQWHMQVPKCAAAPVVPVIAADMLLSVSLPRELVGF